MWPSMYLLAALWGYGGEILSCLPWKKDRQSTSSGVWYYDKCAHQIDLVYDKCAYQIDVFFWSMQIYFSCNIMQLTGKLALRMRTVQWKMMEIWQLRTGMQQNRVLRMGPIIGGGLWRRSRWLSLVLSLPCSPVFTTLIRLSSLAKKWLQRLNLMLFCFLK